MNEKFTPIKFLQPEEISLLKKTKMNIKQAKNENQLKYYESVLDYLMKSAIKNYQNQQTESKHLQRA